LKKIAGRRWLCYCSAAAVANEGNNKRMAACSHNAAGVPNLNSRFEQTYRVPTLARSFCCLAAHNFHSLLPQCFQLRKAFT
jgi:hypothetical protein